VHRRATSLAAARFIDTFLQRFPFPVKALQVDGGSAFDCVRLHQSLAYRQPSETQLAKGKSPGRVGDPPNVELEYYRTSTPV